MSDFYQEQYQDYFDKSVSADPSPFLDPFIACFQDNAFFVDIGCGSGRDLFRLKEKGFNAMGIERSPGLAKLAKSHSGCNVLETGLWSPGFPC